MMHVLWIPSWYPTVENPLSGCFFQEQAQALQDRGIRVEVLYPEMRSLHQLSWALVRKNRFQLSMREEEGLVVYRSHGWNLFPKMPKLQMGNWSFRAHTLAERYISENGRPDLIHAQSTLWAGFAAKSISEKWDIPYVVTEHFGDFLIPKAIPTRIVPLIPEVLERASSVVSVSRALGRSLASYTGSDPLVIPNSVDPNFFTLPNEPRQKEPFRFLAVSSLEPIKNLEMLLSSFRGLLEHDSHCQLDLVGEGPQRQHLTRLCKTLGIEQAVHFRGACSREGVRDAMHRCHALVLPSRYETFGVVLIEALATGMPVIATRCGGPEDIVTVQVGSLVERNDAESLSMEMAHIKNNIHQFDPNALRKYALSRFGHTSIAEKQIEIYHSCVG